MKIKDLATNGLFCDGDWIESKDQDPEGEIRLIQLADIGDGHFIDKSSRFMNLETATRLKCSYLSKNDILIARMPDPIGRACIFPFDESQKFVTVVDVALLRLGSDVNSKYVMYALNSTHIRNSIKGQVTGTTRQRITRKKIGELEIPLPPLEEQKKIAAILDAADEYRQKTKALIDKYDRLTQSLFLDMFGDPVTNPKGWQRFQLKEFGKIITGNTPSKKHPEYYDQSFIEWIKTDNIVDGVKCITPSKSYLSQNGLKHGRSVKAGSVLIACIAGSLKSIGKAALTDRTVAFNQQINAVEPNNTVDSNFLYYLIRVNKVYIQSFASSSMKKMISKGVLKEIAFYLPPIEIQNQFTEKVEQIEKQKQQAEASLVKAEELFNSLLQRAFKGELTC